MVRGSTLRIDAARIGLARLDALSAQAAVRIGTIAIQATLLNDDRLAASGPIHQHVRLTGADDGAQRQRVYYAALLLARARR